MMTDNKVIMMVSIVDTTTRKLERTNNDNIIVLYMFSKRMADYLLKRDEYDQRNLQTFNLHQIRSEH